MIALLLAFLISLFMSASSGTTVSTHATIYRADGCTVNPCVPSCEVTGNLICEEEESH